MDSVQKEFGSDDQITLLMAVVEECHLRAGFASMILDARKLFRMKIQRKSFEEKDNHSPGLQRMFEHSYCSKSDLAYMYFLYVEGRILSQQKPQT